MWENNYGDFLTGCERGESSSILHRPGIGIPSFRYEIVRLLERAIHYSRICVSLALIKDAGGLNTPGYAVARCEDFDVAWTICAVDCNALPGCLTAAKSRSWMQQLQGLVDAAVHMG